MTLAVLPTLPDTDLPRLTIELPETNPHYEPIFVEGSNDPINKSEYQKKYMIEVEVVQLNLNSGGMRIRYPWYTKHNKKGYEIRSRDVGIGYFFDQYSIVENKNA